MDEEVLDTGPGLPRWLPWVGGAVATVLAVALLLVTLSHHDSGNDSGNPAASRSATSTASVPPVGAPVNGIGEDVPLAGPGPALDVAMVGDTAWILQDGTISVVNPHGGVLASVKITNAEFARRSGVAQLVVDASGSTLWIYFPHLANSSVLRLDARTLDLQAVIPPGPAYDSAAALDGTLYLSSHHRLLRVRPGQRMPVAVSGIPPLTGALVADPLRARLLVFEPERTGAQLVAIGSSGAVSTTALRQPVVKATIAVTGSGRIWLGGFGASGAILERLDPGTLQVSGFSSVVDAVGPGAVVVAAGRSDLLVTSGGGAQLLWCVHDVDGTSGGSWNVNPEFAALTPAGALVIDGGQVRALALPADCAG